MRTSYSRSVVCALAGILWLMPLAAHAEPNDPADIAHAVALVSVLGFLFFGMLGFGIWILVARLRTKDMPLRSQSGLRRRRQIDFDKLWFHAGAAELARANPAPPVQKQSR